MITPTKYMNLDYSLLNVSAMLIKEFSKQSIISYDELLQITVSKIGKHAKEITPYALNFLFLLGKIEYHHDLDVFEIKR
ncbi:hypothetical protein QUF72_05250 [Desulfobacterales bacterium HSG2]|nr:hypothetical protein [Desulfobacterales bacterium HSG2]